MPLRILIFEGVFLYFCRLDNSKIKLNMEIFLTSALFFLLVYLAIKQILKNRNAYEPVDDNAKWLPCVLLVCAVTMLMDYLLGSTSFDAVYFYLSLALLPIYPLTSSVIPLSWTGIISIVSISLQAVSILISVVCRFSFRYTVPDTLFCYASVAVCSSVAMIFLASICLRLYDIKMVMRTGSVWSMVCLSVDSLYVISILLVGVALPYLDACSSIVILTMIIIALSLRIRNASVFVIFTDHERKIVESMKVSQVECTCESSGTDQLYNNIYERLLHYFEKHKPFLNHELTINDIVEVVFTNKLYISRAISHCTGRNFCQFVNYYRITHAVELFRSNPQLKVVELADLCGFNSTTSFSAAFRLYMGESPGDWCRKERVRLTKK